jgi:sec-independent protein translocase protein TatB
VFGLTLDKVVVIAIIAVFVLGPERLPHYAQQLARLAKTVREMANGARDRMREEMGPEFDDLDWKKLDPRQYDPRRIIREALLDDEAAPVVRPAAPAPAVERRRAADAGLPAPYDAEST